MRFLRAPAWCALVLVSLVLATLPARGDLEFQAVDEWTPFTFRYPSGRFRLLSEGAEIRAYDRALADTTGEGIPFDLYFSHLNESGDSIGVFVWVNLPAGKYFFVETAGADSLFEVPDYHRAGFDLAPPASVDSNAIIPSMVLTRHLGDSLIDSPKYIKAGVIRNAHLAPNIDGAKLIPGTVAAVAIDSVDGARIMVGTLPPTSLVAGRRFFSFGSSDSAEVALLEAYEIRPPAGEVGAFTGTWYFSDATGLVSFSGPQVVFQDSTDFRDPVQLGQVAGDLITVTGDLRVENDMLFGLTRADTSAFRGPAHFEDLQLLDASSMVCDSFPSSGSTEAYVVVDGVSELQADGYAVHCRATPDFNFYQMYNLVGGSTYTKSLFAAPVRQDPTAPTDSVYVILSVSVLGSRWPFCVECFGVK